MRPGSVVGQHRRELPIREQRLRHALSNPGAIRDIFLKVGEESLTAEYVSA